MYMESYTGSLCFQRELNFSQCLKCLAMVTKTDVQLPMPSRGLSIQFFLIN